jgi:hypothetical protein
LPTSIEALSESGSAEDHREALPNQPLLWMKASLATLAFAFTVERR